MGKSDIMSEIKQMLKKKNLYPRSCRRIHLINLNYRVDCPKNIHAFSLGERELNRREAIVDRRQAIGDRRHPIGDRRHDIGDRGPEKADRRQAIGDRRYAEKMSVPTLHKMISSL